jgi:signal peptidase I
VKTVERSSIEDPEPKDGRPRQGFLGFLGEVPGLILMAFVLALLIRTFLFQAFFIPSPSMEQTLQEGDRVLVNRSRTTSTIRGAATSSCSRTRTRRPCPTAAP